MFLHLNGRPLQLLLTANFWSEPLPAIRFIFVPQSWTIALELMFYVLAPALCPLARVLPRTRNGRQLGCACFYILLVWVEERSMDLPFLSLRTCLFRRRHICVSLVSKHVVSRGGRASDVSYRCGSGIAAWSATPGPLNLEGSATVQYPFYATAAMCLPWLFAQSKSFSWDRATGELSYSLYMSHWMVLSAVKGLLDRVPAILHGLLIAVMCVAVSILLYLVVERRIERWRMRLFDRARMAAPLPGVQIP